jgi:hypothetical protein
MHSSLDEHLYEIDYILIIGIRDFFVLATQTFKM